MRRPWVEIEAELTAAGFASTAGAGPVPAPDGGSEDAADGAWYVRTLAGLGGWVAALFLGIFLGARVAGTPGFVVPILGAAVLGGGLYGLQRTGGDFARQLSLAASLAGQGLLVFGVSRLTDGWSLVAAFTAALELVLLTLCQRPVHRFLCTWGAAVAVAVLVFGHGIPLGADLLVLAAAGLAGWLWLSVPGRLARGLGQDPWLPVAHALGLALLAGLLLATLSAASPHALQWHGERLAPGRLASGGLGLLLVLLVLLIQRERGAWRVSLPVGVGVGALALLGLVTPGAPGLPAAAGALLLAFHRRSPVLLGVSVLFMVAFLTLNYYSLQASLLDKALRLMGTGAALALAALLVGRRWQAE